MDKKIRNWILVSLNESPAKRGLYPNEIFEKRPEFMNDLTFNEVDKYLDELRKEGLLDTGSRDKHFLTGEGEKEVKKYLRNASPLEMFNLSRTVPRYGHEYRIKVLEGFIGSLFMMVAIGLGVVAFENYFNTHSTLAFVISISFLIFLFFSIGAGVTIALNFLIVITKGVYTPLSKLIVKNIKIFFAIIFIIALVSAVFVFIKLTNYDFKEIMARIVAALVVGILLKIKSIIDYLESKFKKITNQ